MTFLFCIDAPYVLYIFDIEEQVLFIERNTQVFSDEIAPFKHIKHYLNCELQEHGLEVDVKPLTSKGAFWDLVNELDKIYSVTFTLNAPNFLGESYDDLKMILDKESGLTNANQIEYSVRNESGYLHIPKNKRFQSTIGWVEDGGGEWKIKAKSHGKKKGRKKTYKNSQHITTFDVDADSQSPSPETLEIIKKSLNLDTHKIKGRNNG